MSLRTISEPRHVFGNASTATIPVIAAMTNPNRTVAVHQIILTASAATSVTVQDSSGTALSETFQLGPTKALVLDQQVNTDPWFTTAPGLGMQLAQSAAANIGFDVFYTAGAYPAGVTGGVPSLPPYSPASWSATDNFGGITLSNSNLTATGTSANAVVRGTIAYSANRLYWEQTISVLGSGTGVGIATAACNLTTMLTTTAGAALVYSNGFVLVNTINLGSSLPGLVAGNVIGIAVDLTAHVIWFRVNPTGLWNGNAANNPSTGIGGINLAQGPAGTQLTAPVFPLFAVQHTSDVCTINTNGVGFTGSIPSGYVAPG